MVWLCADVFVHFPVYGSGHLLLSGDRFPFFVPVFAGSRSLSTTAVMRSDDAVVLRRFME